MSLALSGIHTHKYTAYSCSKYNTQIIHSDYNTAYSQQIRQNNGSKYKYLILYTRNKDSVKHSIGREG